MFAALIEKLQRHQDLSREEAAEAMETIMDGRAQPAHTPPPKNVKPEKHS